MQQDLDAPPRDGRAQHRRFTELILNKMAQTRTNDEFLQSVTKEALSMSRSRDEGNGKY